MKHFFICGLVVLLVFACKKKQENKETEVSFTCSNLKPEPKGNRIIGLDLLNTNENGTFENNISHAKDLGAEFLALHLNWTSIEQTPNAYSDPGNALYLLNQSAKINNLKFSLTIRPIDLTGKTVPADLDSMRFNDTHMINRFKKVVDFVFDRVDANILLNLQIGNEIDKYDFSKEHPDFWADYGVFLNALRNHIKLKNNNVNVSFTGTLEGMLTNKTRFNLLAKNMDHIGVTYYPLKENFDVKKPDDAMATINTFVQAFDSKPIYFQELGYQTSESNSSSETEQADFFCRFFKVWDTYKDKIRSVNILRLNDLSLEEAKKSAGPYGLSNPEFIEYLRTLGIRTYDGKGNNKKAFDVIKKNLAARNW